MRRERDIRFGVRLRDLSDAWPMDWTSDSDESRSESWDKCKKPRYAGGDVVSVARAVRSERVMFGGRICVRRRVGVPLTATTRQKPEKKRPASAQCVKRGRRRRTDADGIVVAPSTMHDVTRPRVVPDPPDKPLRAMVDLTDALLARQCGPRELVSPVRHRVRYDSDFD